MTEEMSEQTGGTDAPIAEVPAGVAFWDELLLMRQEQIRLQQDLDEHRQLVTTRHEKMLQQLTEIAGHVAANTAAREDYEMEIKQLHSVMRQWYHAMIDLQRVALRLQAILDPDNPIFLPPPTLPRLLKDEDKAA